MPQLNSETLKIEITSALKPVEKKLDLIFAKLGEICNEIRDLKLSTSHRNNEGSLPLVSQHNNSANTTPVSSTASTPTSRPSLTDDRVPVPQKTQRVTALRAKEKLVAQTKRPPLQTKRPIQPAKQDPAPAITSNETKTDSPNIPTNQAQNKTFSSVLASSITTPKQTEMETPMDDPQTEQNDWTTVKNRRKSRKPLAIKGTATNTSIGGVDPQKYLHGCFFKKETTPESLISHLQQIHAGPQYIVEQIPSKHDSYNSFKIGVPKSVYDKFQLASAWPINTNITEWQPFLRPRAHKPPDGNENQKQSLQQEQQV